MFSFKQAMDLAIARVVSITGRSSRAEYWWVQLVIFALIVVLMTFGTMMYGISNNIGFIFDVIINIILIPVYVIAIIIGIRRLHDRDMSGWWMLLQLIPLIGGIVLFVLFILPSKPGVNRFGISPVEDPQGHYNYYVSKQFNTGLAYGASAYVAQPGFNNMNYGNMQGQPMQQPMQGQQMYGQPMQQPMQGQQMYGQPMQQPMQPQAPQVQAPVQQPNQNQQQ